MPTRVLFTCPNPVCGKRLQASAASAAGKSARCHGCGTTFRLERSTSADGSESLAPTDAELPLPVAPAVSPTALPTTIGRFRVTGALGGGAFGLVYRAHDPELDREVAIKVPRPGTLTTPTRVKRFLGDAKAAARLRHPHIVPVFDVGENAGSWFIASAFVRGRTLAEAAEAGLPLRTRADVVRRLADALDYAHGEGVIHRDVKPLNVMLDESDHPHLIDFGLAKLGDDREGGGRAVMGTPSYMSPEQAAGRSHDADARSDQYSLGVTLYELLVGRTPFSGPPSVVQVNVVRNDPPPLLAIDPTLPLDLVLICQRAMTKDPAGRYASCGEFADDLRRWLAGETPRVRVLTRRERLVRWVRKDPKLAAAVGLATAAVLLTAVLGVTFGITSTRQAAALAAANDELEQSQAATAGERDRANVNADRATRNAREAQVALASAHYDRAVGLCEQGEIAQGMNWFLKAIQQATEADDPDLERAARQCLAAWAFEQNTLAQVVPLPFHPHAVATLSETTAVVAGEADGKGYLTLFDSHTGERALPLVPAESPIRAVVVPPAGGWFATGGDDGCVRAWKADGTATEARVKLPASVLALAAHPTKPQLLAGCADGFARIVTWAESPLGVTLTPSEQKFRHEDGFAVYAVAFHPHPDTPLVLTGSGAPPDRPTAGTHLGEVRQYRTDTGEPHHPPVPHPGAVHGVAYRPDGVHFASGTGSLWMGEGRVWATDSHRPIQVGVFPHIAEVNAVAYGPGGQFLVTAGQDRSVRVWDAATFRPVGQPMRHTKDVRAVAVLGDRVLAVGDEDAVRVWRVATGPRQSGDGSEDGGPILSADRSAEDTTWVSSLGGVGGIRLPTLKRRQGRTEVNVKWPDGVTPGPVRAITHRAARVAVGGGVDGQAGFAALFDDDGTPLKAQPSARKAAVWAVGLSADGNLLAVGCDDGGVAVWAVNEGRWLWGPSGGSDGHTGRVYAAAIHPDGRTLLTCARDNTARLWDATTGRPLLPRPIPLPNIGLSAVFDDDGKHILIGYAGGCRLFRWAGGESEPTEMGADLPHQAGIVSVSVSADGSTAVTGGTDRRVRCWDLSSGKPIGPAWTTAGLVRAAKFTAADRVFVADTNHRSGAYREFTLPAPAGEPLPLLKAWVERTSGMRLVNRVAEVVPVDERLPDDDTVTGRAITAWRNVKPRLAPPPPQAVALNTSPPPVTVKPPPTTPPKPTPPPTPSTPTVAVTLTRTKDGKTVRIDLGADNKGTFTVTGPKGEVLLRAKLAAALDDWWVGVATPADTNLPANGVLLPDVFTFEFKVAADRTVSGFEADECPPVQKLAAVVNGKYDAR